MVEPISVTIAAAIVGSYQLIATIFFGIVGVSILVKGAFTVYESTSDPRSWYHRWTWDLEEYNKTITNDMWVKVAFWIDRKVPIPRKTPTTRLTINFPGGHKEHLRIPLRGIKLVVEEVTIKVWPIKDIGGVPYNFVVGLRRISKEDFENQINAHYTEVQAEIQNQKQNTVTAETQRSKQD